MIVLSQIIQAPYLGGLVDLSSAISAFLQPGILKFPALDLKRLLNRLALGFVEAFITLRIQAIPSARRCLGADQIVVAFGLRGHEAVVLVDTLCSQITPVLGLAEAPHPRQPNLLVIPWIERRKIEALATHPVKRLHNVSV